MRILLFLLLIIISSCGSESTDSDKNQTESSTSTDLKNESTTTITSAPKEIGSKDVNAKFIKTAKNSEFAVFKATSKTEKQMEYYFKTVDGILLKVTVLHEGDREVKGFNQLLLTGKYLEGYQGGNPEMADKIFELIYDKDNFVSEVRLAEVDE